jgi:hypothetical protein
VLSFIACTIFKGEYKRLEYEKYIKRSGKRLLHNQPAPVNEEDEADQPNQE